MLCSVYTFKIQTVIIQLLFLKCCFIQMSDHGFWSCPQPFHLPRFFLLQAWNISLSIITYKLICTTTVIASSSSSIFYRSFQTPLAFHFTFYSLLSLGYFYSSLSSPIFFSISGFSAPSIQCCFPYADIWCRIGEVSRSRAVESNYAINLFHNQHGKADRAGRFSVCGLVEDACSTLPFHVHIQPYDPNDGHDRLESCEAVIFNKI